ncbi:MAG TPA: efflux RND transporter periplasmic adaptor subunit [Flavitalea sp.]|nr:efflux RND transporter periplasmic adaptor subunit [Flavitalea sp.]
MYKVLWMFVIYISVFASCKNDKKVAVNKDVYYTCSMHPQINEPHPGKCPICEMVLIEVTRNNVSGSDEIILSDQQIQLGNIVVDTLGKGVIANETVLNATLNYNQQKLTSVSSRVMGRIDKLYHKNIGDYIGKGAPLMEVYSEELNNAKQEYLLALERKKVLDNSLVDFNEVINSAKTKLLLLGMDDAQINALANPAKAKLSTTVFSNQSGYITALNVQEGEYIAEGGLIVTLADLSSLWVEAQIYASQFSQINHRSTVTVQLPDIGKNLSGKLEFINPEIDPDKRVNMIRVTIPNEGNRLKPGMPAYVVLKEGEKNVLSLPTDAIIRDAAGATVWIKTGNNTFKIRMVTIGMESGDQIEIINGLKQGEAVVTGGAYLINSEYIFRKGSSPMSGMKM